MVGVIRKIKMARDWFGRVCVDFFILLIFFILFLMSHKCSVEYLDTKINSIACVVLGYH